METTIVGLLCFILGVLLNEYIRRMNRIEMYAPNIFAKRMQVYEKLLQVVSDNISVINDIVENPVYSREERHQIVSDKITNIAKYLDKNEFYLNPYITVQCMSILMGAEDVYYIEDEEAKKIKIDHIWQLKRDTIRMIKEDSGIQKINSLFGSITEAKLDSPMINYYRKLEEEQRKKESTK